MGLSKIIKRIFPLLLLLQSSCIIEDLFLPEAESMRLEVGMSWRWKETIYFEEKVPPSFPPILAQKTITARVVSHEMMRSYRCLKLEIYDEGAVTFKWLANTDTALLFVAVKGEILDPIFRVGENFTLKMGNRTFHGLHELKAFIHRVTMGIPRVVTPGDIYFFDPPQKTLDYPLYKGKKWVVFEDPWYREREVLGTETIEVPAGTFETIKLMTRDSSLNIISYDWITEDSYIKKKFITEIEVSDPNGNYLGTYILVDEWVLLEGPYALR
jgi:signal peptidase I